MTTKYYQGTFDYRRRSWLLSAVKHEELKADLAKVATEYNHSVLQQALLDNYKEPLLLLRAKYASYETIVKLLAERGVKVSVGTIRKFCLANEAEVKRLRAELKEQMTVDHEETPPATTDRGPTSEGRTPLTTEPGKRGPRVARDNF
jgi:hypothetical protein